MQTQRVKWRGVENKKKGGRDKGKMYEGSSDSVWHLAKEEDSVKWRSSIHRVDKPT